jgi:hypothetical protein
MDCSSISPVRNLSARTDSISRMVNREIKRRESGSATTLFYEVASDLFAVELRQGTGVQEIVRH